MAMNLLSREEVSKIARKVVEDEKMTLIDYVLCKKSAENLGFLGSHLTLTLELSSNKIDKMKRRLFVKTYESKRTGEDFLGSTGVFQRELDFYAIVLEDVKNCIGEPDWCPKHYFSKDRALVLEDLSERGFDMVKDIPGKWAMDVKHTEKAIETLASMHATSIVLESRKGNRLPTIYPEIFDRELLYDENKLETPTQKWINTQIKDLLEGVNYLEKYSYEEKNIIKERFGEQIMRLYPLSKISQKYRNVITHGDLWRNNLLFQYSTQKTPSECRFVDFQFVRYSPPAHDVSHLLHFATTKETRHELESHFLELYYKNLSQRLKSHGVNPDEELKKEEFRESYIKYKELALTQCLLSLHYILGSVHLTINTETYEQYEEYLTSIRKRYMNDFFNQKAYADKIIDIFEELIDCYILRERTNGGI